MNARIACMCIGFSLNARAALATDIPVAPGQSIQAAIVAATAGDRVLVQPGTYAEAFDFLGKNIQVIGVGGADVTTIDATGLGQRVVTLKSNEPTTTLLKGLTLTGGSSTVAGGVLCSPASAVIEECIIENSFASNGAGGIAIGSSAGLPAPMLRRCIVRGNSTNGSGGGVWGGNLEYVRIEGNTAALSGGGVYQPLSVRHCRIVGNTATDGGGISLSISSPAPFPIIPTIEFTTFVANHADYAGGFSANGLFSVSPFGCTFESNVANVAAGGMAMSVNSASFALGFLSTCVFRNNVAPPGAVSGALLSASGTMSVFNVAHCVFDGDDVQVTSGLFNVRDSILVNHPNPAPGANVVKSISTFPFPGSVNVNPSFFDSIGGDYHLTAPSPAIDAGTSSGTGAASDYEGDLLPVLAPADIGADEYAPHLYLHGDASAGSSVALRAAGKPGDTALLFLSSSLAPTPIPTTFGAFALGIPILFDAPIALGSIPPSGVFSVAGVLPANAPTFATVYAQVLFLGSGTGTFTNVETIVIL